MSGLQAKAYKKYNKIISGIYLVFILQIRCTFTSTKQVTVDLIRTGGELLHPEFRELVNSVWNKKELPRQ